MRCSHSVFTYYTVVYHEPIFVSFGLVIINSNIIGIYKEGIVLVFLQRPSCLFYLSYKRNELAYAGLIHYYNKVFAVNEFWLKSMENVQMSKTFFYRIRPYC